MLGSIVERELCGFNEKIAGLDRDIRARAREQEEITRLMTIPGVGPICAMAVNAFAPPMESFRRGRDFAAWTGLTPRQNSTAGKQRLGRITKCQRRSKISPPGRSKTSPLNVMRYAVLGGCPGSP